MLGQPRFLYLFAGLFLSTACGADGSPAGATERETAEVDVAESDAGAEPGASGPTLRSDVEAITEASDAKPGAVIPPFVQCREPQAGEPAGEGPEGKVCTPTSIAGCTEEGRYYPDYGDCDVVLTQRPYWSSKPAGVSTEDDPRLSDPDFVSELDWVTTQLEASGCTCCHDSRQRPASQWDINLGPIWTDTISDSGVSLFVGFADSRSLGAYPAEENNGFDRSLTGVPTTDTARMKAFFMAELARRGISEEKARSVTPFGGPVYRSLTAPPEQCAPAEGVSSDGTVTWATGSPARYVYILEAGSDNPGVPPNLDLPEGTLWRLDVLASSDPVANGIQYGKTPKGTFQAFPETGLAPELENGKTYHLYVLLDVGIAIANCLFTYEG